MANVLAKAIKLKKKEFAIKTRLLGLPRGTKCYILKRDGKTKPFTILAEFTAWDEAFSNYRTSKTFLFAASAGETFQPFATSRTMNKIASIGTHIAVVQPDSDSHVYEIRKGDEWTPYYFDWTYTFFVTSCSDSFVPANNGDIMGFLIKSADFIAVAGNRYQVDTSDGDVVVTLPASATPGDPIEIEDAALTWDVNTVTLSCNGLKINSGTSNFVANTAGQKLSLAYISTEIGWSVK